MYCEGLSQEQKGGQTAVLIRQLADWGLAARQMHEVTRLPLDGLEEQVCVCPCICLHVYVGRICADVSAGLSVCLTDCLSVCPPVRWSVCLSVFLSGRLSVGSAFVSWSSRVAMTVRDLLPSVVACTDCLSDPMLPIQQAVTNNL